MKPSSSKNPRLFRTVLPNGLIILVQPISQLASVSVGFSVAVGSRDEAEEEAGLSHLVEHMFFQGTRQRDTRELSRVINAVGGTLDACTGRESTAFYAKVPARYFSLAMDVLADMLLNSRLTGTLLEKEKQIIVEEIRMYEDDPDELVHDLLFQAFWPRHALGRSILGSRKSLARIRRADLLSFVQRHYRANRMILSVAGNIAPAQVVRLARRYFNNFGQNQPGTNQLATAPRPLLKSQIKLRDLEQTHICLGVPGLPFSDQRRITALALSNILGAGTNSRLFYEVREKRALVYSIYSFVDFYYDTGMGGIYFACHPSKIKATLKIIATQLQHLCSHSITDQEWHDVREQMRGNYLISLESSSTHMWNMIQQEMYLQHQPEPASILSAIQKIKKTDIQKLARELFRQTPIASAVIGKIPRTALQQLQSLKIQ
ncbi:insulinase family protein [bacterium]|nr:insulinase family protein [bacterium]